MSIIKMININMKKVPLLERPPSSTREKIMKINELITQFYA